MQDKNKYVRNLTIGAVTGGLIVGGGTLVLNDSKPFIKDYIETYQVTTDATIRTTEGLTRLNPTSEFLTSDEIEEMNELEVKSYTPSKDDYDVDVYGFTNGSLKDEEITTKQNQFENLSFFVRNPEFEMNNLLPFQNDPHQRLKYSYLPDLFVVEK